jgi:hypothetical protein
MAYPSVDQFKDLILASEFEAIVREHIFSGVPFAFREQPQLLDLIRHHLKRELGLVPESVLVIGSAQTGFSLNPDNFPRRFSDESDIDVLVVDQSYFDRIWITVLKWHYRRRGLNLGAPESNWQQRMRKNLFWGSVMPHKIRYEGLLFQDDLVPLRDLSTKWFNAFRSLSLYPEFARRDISGLLYRSWDHALLYQAYSLRQIRNIIRRGSGGET